MGLSDTDDPCKMIGMFKHAKKFGTFKCSNLKSKVFGIPDNSLEDLSIGPIHECLNLIRGLPSLRIWRTSGDMIFLSSARTEPDQPFMDPEGLGFTHPKLQSLYLKRIRVYSEPGFINFERLLKSFPQLRHLCIAKISLDETGMQHLCSIIIKQCVHLEKLWINNVQLLQHFDRYWPVDFTNLMPTIRHLAISPLVVRKIHFMDNLLKNSPKLMALRVNRDYATDRDDALKVLISSYRKKNPDFIFLVNN